MRVPQSVPMAARAWSTQPGQGPQPRMPSQPGPGLPQTSSVPITQQQQIRPSAPTQQQVRPSAPTQQWVSQSQVQQQQQQQQSGGYGSTQLSADGTSTDADAIASIARNIPRVGPPFPGSGTTAASPSYAAFIMKLGMYLLLALPLFHTVKMCFTVKSFNFCIVLQIHLACYIPGTS